MSNKILNSSSRLEHFKNLVAVALSDGLLELRERIFLDNRAVQLGLSAAEVYEIMDRGSSIAFTIPTKEEEREEQLMNIVMMYLRKGAISDKDYGVCLDFATCLGVSKTKLNEILILAKGLRDDR